jgi:hypothetical protein
MIDKTADVTSMDKEQVPILNNILDSIREQALSVKHTAVEPTKNTVREGQLVIYDNGAGTKRLYVVTNKKNLGYVNLT